MVPRPRRLPGRLASPLTSVALNSLNPGTVPVGARFRIAGETKPVDHTVTARVQGTGTGGANETQTVAVTNATGGTFKLAVGWVADHGDCLRR